MAWTKGFNVRETAVYVTDGADETYSLGAAYPETRNGVTFGWDSDHTADTRNRNAGTDRRLAGTLPTSTTFTFRVDLPAPGWYLVGLAIGDFSNAEPSAVAKVFDGANLLFTVSGATEIEQFIDASGVIRTAAGWPAQHVTRMVWVVGTILSVSIGYGSSTGLAHLSVTQTEAEPPLPFRTTLGGQQFAVGR